MIFPRKKSSEKGKRYHEGTSEKYRCGRWNSASDVLSYGHVNFKISPPLSGGELG
jgi:hypothetical protein